MNRLKPDYPCCPRCESDKIIFNISSGAYSCEKCDCQWSDSLYVLLQFPEDTSYFDKEEIGYPSLEAEDSQARYISEYEYILYFQKLPEANQYYRPVTWPTFQEYMQNTDEDDSIDELNEAIIDEKGLEDFGDSAYWIPLCNIK